MEKPMAAPLIVYATSTWADMVIEGMDTDMGSATPLIGLDLGEATPPIGLASPTPPAPPSPVPDMPQDYAMPSSRL